MDHSMESRGSLREFSRDHRDLKSGTVVTNQNADAEMNSNQIADQIIDGQMGEQIGEQILKAKEYREIDKVEEKAEKDVSKGEEAAHGHTRTVNQQKNDVSNTWLQIGWNWHFVSELVTSIFDSMAESQWILIILSTSNYKFNRSHQIRY